MAHLHADTRRPPPVTMEWRLERMPPRSQTRQLSALSPVPRDSKAWPWDIRAPLTATKLPRWEWAPMRLVPPPSLWARTPLPRTAARLLLAHEPFQAARIPLRWVTKRRPAAAPVPQWVT